MILLPQLHKNCCHRHVPPNLANKCLNIMWTMNEYLKISKYWCNTCVCVWLYVYVSCVCQYPGRREGHRELLVGVSPLPYVGWGNQLELSGRVGLPSCWVISPTPILIPSGNKLLNANVYWINDSVLIFTKPTDTHFHWRGGFFFTLNRS